MQLCLCFRVERSCSKKCHRDSCDQWRNRSRLNWQSERNHSLIEILSAKFNSISAVRSEVFYLRTLCIQVSCEGSQSTTHCVYLRCQLWSLLSMLDATNWIEVWIYRQRHWLALRDAFVQEVLVWQRCLQAHSSIYIFNDKFKKCNLHSCFLFWYETKTLRTKFLLGQS